MNRVLAVVNLLNLEVDLLFFATIQPSSKR